MPEQITPPAQPTCGNCKQPLHCGQQMPAANCPQCHCPACMANVVIPAMNK